jgi:hypothetical protein
LGKTENIIFLGLVEKVLFKIIYFFRNSFWDWWRRYNFLRNIFRISGEGIILSEIFFGTGGEGPVFSEIFFWIGGEGIIFSETVFGIGGEGLICSGIFLGLVEKV